jgi:hypothetical protein
MLHIIQMGSKKTGLEMLAEALRDIAILVAVFTRSTFTSHHNPLILS